MHQHLAYQLLKVRVDLDGESQGFVQGLDKFSPIVLILYEKGVAAKQHLVCDYAQTPHITFLIVLFLSDDLGCHGEGRAHPGGQKFIIVKEFGKSEVSQFHLKILGDQNILQFKITVNYPMLSYLLKSPLELDEDAPDLILWQFTPVVLLDELIQICFFAMLKDKVEVMTRLLEVNQLDNIFVFDHSERIEFLVDAFQTLLWQILQADLFDRIDFTLAEGFVYGGVGTFAYGSQQNIGSHFSALLTLCCFFHLYNYYFKLPFELGQLLNSLPTPI